MWTGARFRGRGVLVTEWESNSRSVPSPRPLPPRCHHPSISHHHPGRQTGLPSLRDIHVVFRGNLAGAIALANGKAKTSGSPGGIRTLVTMETPAQEYKLQGRRYRPGSVADERRAVGRA